MTLLLKKVLVIIMNNGSKLTNKFGIYFKCLFNLTQKVF